MGYNEKGECPMFIENKCSIYSDRPQTCRTYDCRIFSATKIELDSEAQLSIREQARMWKFEYPTESDSSQQVAVLTAADFLKNNRNYFPPKSLPNHPAALASLAIKVHRVFLEEIGSKKITEANPSETAKAILKILSE